ncbi:hypothetical protein [Clostridioides difficile]|uniref:hypothetical protein n=1 Tax=Clostridioides difficile TaxID=1496 RepID=UPI001034AC3F|nr:hypothetical protein [Clostridioides difficile]MDM9944000.1 hypothetical protein [Clostridioides difficile]
MNKINFKNTLIKISTAKNRSFFIRLLTIIILVVTFLGVLNITFLNKKINSIYSKRITTLDRKETTKLWVIEDIRSFLLITDENSYIKAKKDSHFTDDLKYKIFGAKYDESKFYAAEEVSIQEAEYTLESSAKDEIYCIKAISKKEDKKYIHKYLVFVSNNYIYDIKVI